MFSGVTDGTVVTVTVSDAAADLWRQMKQQAKQQAERFYNLGRAGGGTVDGQQYTYKQCFIKALELNDQHAQAWFGLSHCGGGSVGGQQYTEQQCCDRRDEIRVNKLCIQPNRRYLTALQILGTT